jgi:hypothetical protein
LLTKRSSSPARAFLTRSINNYSFAKALTKVRGGIYHFAAHARRAEGVRRFHLGDEKHDPAGAGSRNSRNGVRSKTVLTEVCPVEIEGPRDRGGSFEPQIVKKPQRRLSGVDEMVLSPAESAEALSAAADELSTAASSHTPTRSPPPREPIGGGLCPPRDRRSRRGTRARPPGFLGESVEL